MHTPSTATSSTAAASCYVVRIGGDAPTPAARAEIATAKDGSSPATGSRRSSRARPATQITVEVTEATTPAEDTFNLTVSAPGRQTEVYEDVSTKRGKNNVVTVVKEQSKLIQLEEIGTASALERVPARGEVALAGAESAKPVRLTPDDYVGDSADRTGFGGLEAIDEVTMLAVPGPDGRLPGRA